MSKENQQSQLKGKALKFVVAIGIIPAAVATMVPQQRGPSAYGTFTAAYGMA